MKLTAWLFACVFLVAFSLAVPTARGQNGQVSGTVTDSTSGNALPGVNVLSKGTTVGTATDAEGAYSLDVPSLQDTLVFSFVGYQTEEVPINGRSTIDVELSSEAAALEEVVVVGYGEQQASQVSSSISEVSGEEIDKMNTSDPRAALQGLAPGVAVINRSGAPGTKQIDFRIRGNTTIGSSYPLILVNGIEQDFSDIDPNNIKSISVLKDASAAAIYGSRGANGVVLVKTKEPTAGDIEVSYNGYYGVEEIAQKPDQLGLKKYMRLRNVAYTNVPGGGPPKFSEQEIINRVTADDRLKYPLHNTWYDALFQRGAQQNHSLAFSGGSERIQSRFTLNFFNEPGIIPNFSTTRKSAALNANLEATDWLNVDTRLLYRRKDRKLPNATAATMLFDIWHDGGFTVPKYPDGTYGISPRTYNPLLAAEKSGVRKRSTDHLLANVKAKAELLDNLTFTTQVGGHTNLATNSNFHNSYVVHDHDNPNQIAYDSGRNYLNEYRSREQRWTWRNLLKYNLTPGENHAVKLLAGHEQTWEDAESLNGFRDQFYNNELRNLNAGAEENRSNSGAETETRLLSFFGRARYTYADRYIFEGSARYDGSSRFQGAANQYSFFPAFSAAWRVAQEDFWSPLKPAISAFKLRGSWGQTGNNTVGLYTFFPGITIASNYVFGGDLVRTAYSYDQVNPNLTWETTTEWDAGVDAEFLDGLFNASADVYKKRTDGILLTLPIPSVIGKNAPPQNAGVVENTGWELSIGHQNVVSDDFNYSIKANLSNFHNEVIDLENTGPYLNFLGVTKVGAPLNALWGFKALGLFQSEEEVANYPTYAGKGNTFPGDIKYADINGYDEDGNLTGEPDGKINGADKTVIGNRDPHYSFGVTTNVNFKNFDLSFFIQGVGQQDRMPTGAARECGNWGSLTLARCADYWTPENRDASIPRPQKNSRKNSTYDVNSSFWVIDASYVKLKNAQLGYTLPSKFTDRYGVHRLRIYAQGRNLLTLSDATDWGMDPELRSGRLSYYPHTRLYTIGVNLSF